MNAKDALAVYLGDETDSPSLTGLEQYTTSTTSDHDTAKRSIATALQHEARGRDHAISSAALAERTPVSASTVRDLIPIIRREYRLPIGNCPQGYFIIEDAEEASRQIERFRGQAETSRRSAQDVAAAWNRQRYGQDWLGDDSP